MKSIRLIPVVIFAAAALLIFKGIGLVTNGGYVLVGTEQVQAAGGGGGATEAAAGSGEGAAPTEAVMTDTSPTLDDTAPTLATGPAKAPEQEARPNEGVEVGENGPGEDVPTPSAQSSSAPSEEVACVPTVASVPSEAGAESATGENAEASSDGCPIEPAAVNEYGDAVPTMQDGAGNIVPLATASGDTSEQALLARLGERRASLDSREADLDMRAALLAAAEKKLEERTQQLAALEAQVATLVDEKQAAEDAGFRAIVSMYETMKPKDAAKIFDTLELPVMLKVARAMSARKMSPILAAMNPGPAQALTTALASANKPLPVASATGENLAALPQIVGQ